ESLVALDLKTGQRKWHYQLVHHGLWDMDIPCAPILADITVNGRAIKAVAQPTKQGWLYVFDRITGKPVWPIEERPVEQGTVPGEWYSQTQPFVTKPPAYDRQGVSVDDLIDFTPELRQDALKMVERYKLGPIFTPPVVSTWPKPLATLMLPSATGGANWEGGAFDPETKIFYIFTNTNVTPLGLVKADASKQDFDYTQGVARDPNAPVPSQAGGAGRAGGAGESGRAGGAGGRGGAALSEAGAPIPGGGGGRGGEGGGGLTVQGLPLIKTPHGRITPSDLHQDAPRWKK